MNWIHQLLALLHHPEQIIAWGGYVILFCIIFAETGLMIGFFLPGDSLLFVAGAYAAANPNHLNIVFLLILLSIAAISGDAVGYFIGRKLGRKLYDRPDSRLFKKEHLRRTHDFYEKHGSKTIVLARFIPIVRTFAPTVAGVGEMTYPQFALYNIFGGIGWICLMLLLGYFLGSVPWVKANFEKAVLGIIFLSLLPVFFHWWSERKHAKNVAAPVTDDAEIEPRVDETANSHYNV
jgi:membrane-associated protein